MSREVHLDELEPDAQHPAQGRAEVRLHADDGAPVRAEERHRRVDGVGPDPQHPGLADARRQQPAQGPVQRRAGARRPGVAVRRVAAAGAGAQGDQGGSDAEGDGRGQPGLGGDASSAGPLVGAAGGRRRQGLVASRGASAAATSVHGAGRIHR